MLPWKLGVANIDLYISMRITGQSGQEWLYNLVSKGSDNQEEQKYDEGQANNATKGKVLGKQYMLPCKWCIQLDKNGDYWLLIHYLVKKGPQNKQVKLNGKCLVMFFIVCSLY